MDERRDDWRRGVDENLAGLNAGQRVWERELATFRKKIAEMDDLLRGDTQKETDGLIARLHAIENSLQMLKAVIMKDAAGGKGLVGRVEALESGERTSGDIWKFATAFMVAMISLAGLVFANLDRISAFFKAKSQDPVEQLLDHAKHPHRRHARPAESIE